MRFIYYAVIISFFFSCSESNSLPQDSPGKIGNEILTSDDLFLWIIKLRFDNLSDSLKSDTIQAFIKRKLVQKEVEAGDIKNDEYIIRKLKKWEQEKLMAILYNREISDKILSKERLNTFYQDMQYERRVSVITIKHGDESGHTEEQAKKLIEEIYQKSHSTPFLDLVNSYAEDPESLKDGGIYGWVTKHQIDRRNVIMDSIIWTIDVGSVSKPVHTENRFIIVKVLNERKSSWARVEKDLVKLKRIASRLWQEELNKRGSEYTKKLSEKYHYTLNTQGIDEFINKYKQEKQKSNKIFPLQVLKIIPDMESLGSYMDIDMDKEWLISRSSEIEILHHPSFTNREYFENLLKNIVSLELSYEQARNLGYNKEEGYKKILEKYKLDLYYTHYMQNYVYKKIKASEEDLKAYYNKYKDRFKTEQKVRIALIEVSQKKKANEIYRRLQSGESFEEMTRQFNDKRYFKYAYGDIPAFTEKKYDVLSEAAFRMNINEIHAPIKYKNRFLIIKLLEILPSQKKFFNEVEKDIQKIVIDSRKKEAREQDLLQLRKKYGVEFNESFIDHYNSKKSTTSINQGLRN